MNLLAHTAGGAAAGDVFTSIEGLRGSDFDDTLVGDGNGNVIEGGSGDDTLDGGANGSGADFVSYRHAAAGVAVDLRITDEPQDTIGAGHDWIVNFEGVIGSGHNDTLIGNGVSFLEGGAGDDHLIGQEGGSDTASYASATARVIVDLSLAGQQDTHGAGLDTLTDIANVTGSAFNDILAGDGSDNRFRGLGGSDIFVFNASDKPIGHDQIADFVPGQDRIQLDYLAFTPGDSASFHAWISSHSSFSPQNFGFVIDLNNDGANTITLAGVQPGMLTMNDFVLHPGGGGGII